MRSFVKAGYTKVNKTFPEVSGARFGKRPLAAGLLAFPASVKSTPLRCLTKSGVPNSPRVPQFDDSTWVERRATWTTLA